MLLVQVSIRGNTTSWFSLSTFDWKKTQTPHLAPGIITTSIFEEEQVYKESFRRISQRNTFNPWMWKHVSEGQSHGETQLSVQHCFSTRRRLWRLNSAQKHWGTRPVDPKSRIERLSECGVEGVEVDQRVRGDSVEGQSSSRNVHINWNSVRDWGGTNGCLSLIVNDRVTIIIRADQPPGLIIKSKHTVITESFPSDSSVTHWYINPSSPLHLPVTATSQTSCTQQLPPVFKPVWMIRIRLILFHKCHLPVVVRQFEFSVYCVCVDCELTGIWWREQTQHSCSYWWIMWSVLNLWWWPQRCDTLKMLECAALFPSIH